jgi:hypothetical protein
MHKSTSDGVTWTHQPHCRELQRRWADWSGWRIPERDPDPANIGAGPIPPDLSFIGAAGLAAVGHHLYIFSPREGKNAGGLNIVYAY